MILQKVSILLTCFRQCQYFYHKNLSSFTNIQGDRLMKTGRQKQREQYVRKILAKAIKAFSQGFFSQSWELLSVLEAHWPSHKDLKKIHKVLNLLVLGEFFGYHNLCQLLEAYHLSPHHLYRLWKTCTDEQLLTFVDGFCWLAFQQRLLDLCHKSDATWSRMNVTLVIDSSIYKQILSLGDEIPEFDKFFSGQYHATVYGFRLTLIGMVIGGRFYPIQFVISSKDHAELDIAKTLLAHVKQKLDILATSSQITFPNLFLSVDSGFCHLDLFEAEDEITVISVPKKSWVFEIDGQKMNLKKHIDRFLEEERTSDSPVFPLRKRAVGNTLGEVVLLFFRYNTSHKVSVIVTDQRDIFAKTLRRRWFQRTYIEQFFRFSKHTLNIQSTKSTNASEFDRNVSLNFLKVLVCQTFTAFCREQFPALQHWSFEKIRRHAIYDHVDQAFLENILLDYDNLFHSIDELTA